MNMCRTTYNNPPVGRGASTLISVFYYSYVHLKQKEVESVDSSTQPSAISRRDRNKRELKLLEE